MSGNFRARLGLVAAAAAALAGLGACFSEEAAGPPPPSADCRARIDLEPGSHDVTVIFMRNFTFVPEEARVAPGTVVAWVNCEPEGFTESHTTTSDEEGLWGSDFMNPGDSFFRVFDEVGTFPYHCVPHASFMRAVVIVEDPDAEV